MADEKDNVQPEAKPAAAPDQFPNKSHYEGGHIFNFPVSHYEARTEAEVKQSLLDGGNSEDQSKKDMALIREGLAFHKTDFAKEQKGGDV